MANPEYQPEVPQATYSTGSILETVWHGGVQLPLYDPNTVVWTAASLRKAARKSPHDSLVRYIRSNQQQRFELGELLCMGDATFTKVAKACGSRVIRHSWGLSMPPECLRGYYYGNPQYVHPDLPKGLSIVASVEILPNPKTPSEKEWQSIDIVLEGLRASEPYYIWQDACPSQFLKSQGELVLADIEPFIENKQTKS